MENKLVQKMIISQHVCAVLVYNEEERKATYQLYPVLHDRIYGQYYAPIFETPMHVKGFDNVTIERAEKLVSERVRHSRFVPCEYDDDTGFLFWQGQQIATYQFNRADNAHNVMSYGNQGHFCYTQICFIDSSKCLFYEAVNPFKEQTCECRIMPSYLMQRCY